VTVRPKPTRSATRLLPFVLAFVLGLGAALLTACGSSSKALIPAANADQIKSHLAAVSDAIDVESLPNEVSARLVQRLEDGIARLRRQAPSACAANTATTATTATATTETTTTATTPTTTTATTPTTTTPTTTTPPTTPTTPTTTTSPDTGGVTVVTQ
jgi:DNA uptake protein ComE-like DNA-binding protein